MDSKWWYRHPLLTPTRSTTSLSVARSYPSSEKTFNAALKISERRSSGGSGRARALAGRLGRAGGNGLFSHASTPLSLERVDVNGTCAGGAGAAKKLLDVPSGRYVLYKPTGRYATAISAGSQRRRSGRRESIGADSKEGVSMFTRSGITAALLFTFLAPAAVSAQTSSFVPAPSSLPMVAALRPSPTSTTPERPRSTPAGPPAAG